MNWRRGKLTELLLSLRVALAESGGNERISLSPGPFRFAYNQWLQDWEIWAVRGLVDELIVQNYAYSLKGFQNDLRPERHSPRPKLGHSRAHRHPRWLWRTHHTDDQAAPQAAAGPSARLWRGLLLLGRAMGRTRRP